VEAAELPDAHRRQAVASPALRAAACVVGLVGVALRVWAVGRPGFWTDEPWVAISTRVSGVMQFLVSLSHTPILWAALLRPLARLPLSPEISLRLLPFGFGIFALDIARDHEWPPYPQVQAEDLGPLVHEMERERQPGDHVLLYASSVFVWGYYQTRTPTLLQAGEHLAGGFIVSVDDPDVTLVRRDDVDAAIARAFTGTRRVWFLGSRFKPGDEALLRARLTTKGRVVREEHRDRALLLLLETE
jgi:hypothetical protein